MRASEWKPFHHLESIWLRLALLIDVNVSPLLVDHLRLMPRTRDHSPSVV